MKQSNRNKIRKEERRASAAERQAAHAQLSPEQKLASLDQRLGAGVGAVKERARILRQLQEGQKPVTKATAEAVFGVKEAKGQRRDRRSGKAQSQS
jgi:hypothetical protein